MINPDKSRSLVLTLLWVWCLGGYARAQPADKQNPLAFFQPVLNLKASELEAIDRGNVFVRILPGQEGEVVVFAATALKAGGRSLAGAVRNIEELKRGPFVLAIRRFSDPPAIGDLEALTLDVEDLEAVSDCRTGACGMKLSGPEMQSLQRAAAGGGAQWRSRVQSEFRQLALERVRSYLTNGFTGSLPYEDRVPSVRLGSNFSALIRRSPYLVDRLPQFTTHLENYPRNRIADVESFLYWSKETYGRKPVLAVTHVSILHCEPGKGLPEVLVAGKQVFATHYFEGALALTAVFPGRKGSHNYLVYLNRSHVDILGGLLGWLKRAAVERRLRAETEKIFLALRQRIEATEAQRPPGERYR